jgi:hypothetical protein
MDRVNPLSDSTLLTFHVHDAWRAPASQQSEDLCRIGSLFQLGHLLPRSYVMCSDQSIEHE